MIVDEAQNLTPHEVKTIITRSGDGTKIVLTGDPGQIDNPYVDSASNGLTIAADAFRNEKVSGHIVLAKGERSELAELAAEPPLSRLIAYALVAASAAVGCSSVGASAVRTGPLRLPPHVGAVELYAAGEQVAGADLGVIEVHAAQSEATIDTLLRVFVQKVAQIGGNAAVVESVRARFEIVSHPHVETYTYACGYTPRARGPACIR